jgi:hypothetical protein
MDTYLTWDLRSEGVSNHRIRDHYKRCISAEGNMTTVVSATEANIPVTRSQWSAGRVRWWEMVGN